MLFCAATQVEQKTFELSLELFGEVEEVRRTLNGKSLALVLRKKELGTDYWPRLTKDKVKLQYLKTDFSKWKDEDEQDDVEEEAEEPQGPPGGGMGGMPGMGGAGGPPGGGMDFASMMQGMGGGAGGAGGSMDFEVSWCSRASQARPGFLVRRALTVILDVAGAGVDEADAGQRRARRRRGRRGR